MKNHRYYLGKQGKIFGPYSQAEFDELISSGQIEHYVWLWDFKSNTWKPLEAPPPPVRELGEAPHPTGHPESSKTIAIPRLGVHAICHNFQNALSGELSQITQTGCDFYLSPESAKARQAFVQDSQVYLNLFESQTGRSVQVKAKISRISQTPHGRCYSFRWPELPKIFETAA